jgi:phosphatidylethanolamine-binding protein (PEBP) family uncharacterized protein
MKGMRTVMVSAIAIAVAVGMAVAQAPQGGQGGGRGAGGGAPGGGAPGGGAPGGGGGQVRGGGGRGPVLSVTSPSFPDGGEVPQKHAGGNGGANMTPQFDFKWFNGTMPTDQPATVQAYAIVFHDIENVGRGNTTTDTLHWTVFNIPGTAKGIPEGMMGGDLPDGTRTGPGIRGGPMGQYFGPGAGQGPFHHYVFEFYALNAKLDLPATPPPTREQLMAAMDGKVVGKAAYVGRYHAP